MLISDFYSTEDLTVGGNVYSSCEHYSVAGNGCGS